MKRLACLLALLPLATPALASTPTLLQPTSGARGLQLEVSESRAWMLRPNGQRLRLPLRRGERIEELVELDNGWAAAGGRFVGDRHELVVIVDGQAGVERLRPVPRQSGDLRVRPVPLASQHSLAGLAWLEGDSPAAYEVRVAEWTGADWGPPATVSPARRGGQAGLVGTVLDDGRWLLVWAASGGGPSALYWSIRDGGQWSAPAGLTAPDRAPDVDPTLVRVPGGGLLVWARRQGASYTLQVTRFADRWSAPRRLAGHSGWAPRFAELAGSGRFLLYRAAAGWATVEVDADGRPLRRSAIAGERRDRPVLTTAGDGIAPRWRRGEKTLLLRWKGKP